MKGSRSSSGRRSRCGPRQTVRRNSRGLGRDDVPGLQPAARLGEAGGAQALLGLLGAAKFQGSPKPSKWAAKGSRPATSALRRA